jgi:dTDP-4-amino-4,6-dideoxygalactose transaminase
MNQMTNQSKPPRIWLSSPHMGEGEMSYVQEAFNTNWIAPLGPHVDGFERDLAQYTGVGHAAALSSGTAAIHLALVILGVKPGDQVICQSLTFSASANPIRYLGANPIFVDSEPDTWNMCPVALEKALSNTYPKNDKDGTSDHVSGTMAKNYERPKAIILVHLYGMPAKMDAILEVAKRYDVPVIEDAAEALGSHIGGRMCGSLGTMGILSFNGNKIITTSGGGALLSHDEGVIKKARFLATQARDQAPHYQHSEIGYNYRMSNVLAGIGRGQMLVLDERVSARRENFTFYHDLLEGNPGVKFAEEAPGIFSNRWLTTILIDPVLSGGKTREELRLALEQENIESRPLWKPMHLQPVFSNSPYVTHASGDCAAKLFEQGLCLPSGSNMTDNDRRRIAKTLNRFFRNL